MNDGNSFSVVDLVSGQDVTAETFSYKDDLTVSLGYISVGETEAGNSDATGNYQFEPNNVIEYHANTGGGQGTANTSSNGESNVRSWNQDTSSKAPMDKIVSVHAPICKVKDPEQSNHLINDSISTNVAPTVASTSVNGPQALAVTADIDLPALLPHKPSEPTFDPTKIVSVPSPRIYSGTGPSTFHTADVNLIIQQMSSFGAVDHGVSLTGIADSENSPALLNLVVSSWHH